MNNPVIDFASQASKTLYETATALGTVNASVATKATRLNIEMAGAWLDAGLEQTRRAGLITSPEALVAWQTEMFESAARRGLESAQKVAGLGDEIRGAYADLWQRQVSGKVERTPAKKAA